MFARQEDFLFQAISFDRLYWGIIGVATRLSTTGMLAVSLVLESNVMMNITKAVICRLSHNIE